MTKARDIASAIPAPSTVSSAELGYLDGVTSAIQTQIDSKISSASAINPTIVDAKGDIIAATAADTVARLVVGANGTVLTAASGQATGLEWATPSSGGMTLLSTTTLTGASVTISSISQSYNDLYIVINNPYRSNSFDSGPMRINPNSTNLLFTGTRIQGTNIEEVILQGLNSPTLGIVSAATTSNAFLQIRNYTSSTNSKSCCIHII